jgi:hypothetical protein
VTRSCRLEIRLSEDELAAFRQAAEEAKLGVSAWLRRCGMEMIDVLRAHARNEAQLARQAARLHRLPPTAARELDFGRAWPLHDDEPPEGGSKP